MATKEELILENELLKKKLLLAEAWMRREVAHQRKVLTENSIKKSGRNKLDAILEKESVSIIERRIVLFFGASLENAPKFTINHLIDAEIYWQTLQKFPTLDALPVVSSYQKVLEWYFENILVWFRSHTRVWIKKPWITKKIWSQRMVRDLQNSLDKDIENVLKKKYSLSLGRWFQFFQKLRDGDEFWWEYEDWLLEYLSLNHEKFLETCITDPFYSALRELIDLEVFGKKRHDTKVSYKDAKKVRSICMGEQERFSMVKILLDVR